MPMMLASGLARDVVHVGSIDPQLWRVVVVLQTEKNVAVPHSIANQFDQRPRTVHYVAPLTDFCNELHRRSFHFQLLFSTRFRFVRDGLPRQGVAFLVALRFWPNCIVRLGRRGVVEH